MKQLPPQALATCQAVTRLRRQMLSTIACLLRFPGRWRRRGGRSTQRRREGCFSSTCAVQPCTIPLRGSADASVDAVTCGGSPCAAAASLARRQPLHGDLSGFCALQAKGIEITDDMMKNIGNLQMVETVALLSGSPGNGFKCGVARAVPPHLPQYCCSDSITVPRPIRDASGEV